MEAVGGQRGRRAARVDTVDLRGAGIMNIA